MIRVVAELEQGRTSILILGHEGDVEGGRVCAAVSAIATAAVLGLQEVARAHPEVLEVDMRTAGPGIPGISGPGA